MTSQDLSILGEERQVERDGVSIGYRVAGRGGPVLLMFTAWQIVHSGVWRGQVPYLSRFARVITLDCRGNGRSDRPKTVEAYGPWELVSDALAVLDAEEVSRAVVCGFSYGGHLAALFASRHPDRTASAILLAPTAPFGPSNPALRPENVTAVRDRYEGWEKYSFDYWRRDLSGFAAFFMRQAFPEPHSEKQVEDGCSYAAETDPETLIRSIAARRDTTGQTEEAYAAIRCPVLVVQGTEDRIVPHEKGRLVSRIVRGRFFSLPGAGHMPSARFPVVVNRLIRDFLDECHSPAPRSPAISRRGTRPPRALYVSSPIGLGHVRRDVAVARAIRRLRPELGIDWLAQPPTTHVLEAFGETIHPGSRHLLSECAHIAREAEGHRLHAFQALRRMDAILTANFCQFQDIVDGGEYDLVIADEAWEVDRYWHQHPALKRAKLAWLTDFVGVLPMPEGGPEEARLASDWNAEMIGWIECGPPVRDAALFVGSSEEIVDHRFGEGLPSIRAWTQHHFAMPGDIDPLEATSGLDRDAARRRLGYGPTETICLVAVGGSGIGRSLVERVLAAAPELTARRPGLRFEIVTGPGIDPETLPWTPAVTLRPFVADFPSHLAACDVALVQGGLSTCMELASLGRPFLYVPLEGHFEQQIHVDFRLRSLGAGRRLSFAELADVPRLCEALDALVAEAPAGPVIAPGGAARAAAIIARLL